MKRHELPLRQGKCPPHSAPSLKRPSSERPRQKTAFSWAFSALARSEKGISQFMDAVRGAAVMEANSGKARLGERAYAEGELTLLGLFV
jgi:hypothetical protein